MASLPGLHNRNVPCAGKSVIRDDHNMPILDEDGARQYRPCKNMAANGTHLCGQHGGQLKPTIVAAQRRLAHGSEDLVEILERIAKNENETASDRIKAINSYLDRSGIRAGMDISLETPKWQNVLGKMFERVEDDELAPSAKPEETPKKASRAPARAKPRKASPAAKPSARSKFEGWA